MNFNLRRTKGITLVEVLIGIAIIVSAVIASFLYYGAAIRVAEQSTNKVQAALALSEGAEAVRSMRDASWSNISSLTLDTDYHFYFTGANWQATTTPQQVLDKFQRTFQVDDVYRDGNDDITTSGGTLDPDTRKVNISVTWTTRTASFEESLSTYMTNLFEE